MTPLILLVVYLVSAGAFLILAALSVTGLKGAMRGRLFLWATWGTVLWAIALGLMALGSEWLWLLRYLPIIECLRLGLWLLLLRALIDVEQLSIWQHAKKYGGVNFSLWAWFGALLLGTALLFPWEPMVLQQIQTFWMIALLLLCVIGMVVLENLYRRADTDTRWRLKFFCLGIGGLLLFDFILYADALLFRLVNPTLWAARGVVNALMVPLLAVAAARNRSWQIDIQVSRRLVFHSSIGLLSGLYLIGLALGGYYIRYQGGSWGELAQIVVLFMGTVGLVALLSSKQLRARIRVYVAKNFFSYQFDYREEWLRFNSLLSSDSTQAGQAFDIKKTLTPETRALRAIMGLIDSPRGQLWLMENTQLHLVTEIDMASDISSVDTQHPFLRFIVERAWVIDLQHQNSELPYIPEAFSRQRKARLIVPLFLEKDLFGLVLLGQPHGNVTANWEVNDLLKVAGRQAASYLAQAKAAQELLVARQFESFNKMSAFIVHDLKNLVSQLDLVMVNAPRLIDRPDFQQDMLDTISNSVTRMKRLMEQLQDARMPTQQAVRVDLYGVLLHACEAFRGNPVTVRFLSEVFEQKDYPRVEIVVNAERFERVVRHLLANAVEAVLESKQGSSGLVTLAMAMEADQQATVTVTDNGVGMSPEFVRDQLFAPFESTKSQGTGLGMYESREYLRSVGGNIQVKSSIGAGTTVKIFIPAFLPTERASNIK